MYWLEKKLWLAPEMQLKEYTSLTANKSNQILVYNENALSRTVYVRILEYIATIKSTYSSTLWKAVSRLVVGSVNVSTQ